MTNGWSIRAVRVFGNPPSQASDEVWHAKVRATIWHRGKWITVGNTYGALCYTTRAAALAGANAWIDKFNQQGADALGDAFYAPHITDPDPPEKPMTKKASQRAARRAAKFLASRTPA